MATAHRSRARRYVPRQNLTDQETLLGTRFIEWDDGISEGPHGPQERQFRPTGLIGQIEIWDQNSQYPANLPAQRIPKTGSKVVRILKKNGKPGLRFQPILPNRYSRGGWLLPTGWHTPDVDPNKYHPLYGFSRNSEIASAVPEIAVMASSGRPENLHSLRNLLIVAAYAAGSVGILFVSYALIPTLFMRLRLGWLFLPFLIADMLAWRYFKRPRWPQRYLPFLWWL